MIGDDKLTAARICECKRLCSNAESGKERLDGLTALVEDWHVSGILITISVSMIVYNKTSVVLDYDKTSTTQ